MNFLNLLPKKEKEKGKVSHIDILEFAGDSFKILEDRLKEVEEDLKTRIGMHSDNLLDLRRKLHKLEEKINKDSPENSTWLQEDNYLSSYCPKCKTENRSQIPAKAKRSMSFKCGNCAVKYRIYFDKEGADE